MKILARWITAILLLDHKSQAVDTHKFKFFSRNDNFPIKMMTSPCVQAYPGAHLIVSPNTTGTYSVSQLSDVGHTDHIDLEKQLLQNKFVGDIFCEDKLQTLKEQRTQPLKGISFFNSDYSVNFSDASFLEIEVFNNIKK